MRWISNLILMILVTVIVVIMQMQVWHLLGGVRLPLHLLEHASLCGGHRPVLGMPEVREAGVALLTA